VHTINAAAAAAAAVQSMLIDAIPPHHHPFGAVWGMTMLAANPSATFCQPVRRAAAAAAAFRVYRFPHHDTMVAVWHVSRVKEVLQ
jgi:hypothetical protein